MLYYEILEPHERPLAIDFLENLRREYSVRDNPQSPAYLTDCSQPPRGNMMTARIEGMIVGIMGYTYDAQDFHEGRNYPGHAHVRIIAIGRSFRGSGIFGNLWRAALGNLQSRGFSKFVCDAYEDNLPAMAVWNHVVSEGGLDVMGTTLNETGNRKILFLGNVSRFQKVLATKQLPVLNRRKSLGECQPN